MFSTIVVGTDGSQTARRAVLDGGAASPQNDAKLHVVYGQVDPEETAPGGRGCPRTRRGTGLVKPCWTTPWRTRCSRASTPRVTPSRHRPPRPCCAWRPRSVPT